MARLTARDYKKTSPRGVNVSRFREFGGGMLVGILIATGVFLYTREAQAPVVEEPKPQARKEPAVEPPAAGETAEQYDFYEMLPRFEVVVPEKDRDVKRDVPTTAVERPGVYVLQAGSYRSVSDADRVSRQLALQGVQAKVQRVSIDNDVWHRVRIGPISDLGELNRVRKQLQAADMDALVIRVGD